MSTLFSLYDNPRQTSLVTATEEAVYKITTENKVSSVMRTLPKKLSLEGEEPQFVTIGELNWNRPMTFKVGDGRPVPSTQFLRMSMSDSKLKRFMKMAEETNKREFTDPEGAVYRWTLSGGHAKLRRKGNPEPIATYTVRQGRLLTCESYGILEMKDEAMELLDLILLTWVEVAVLLNAYKSKGLFGMSVPDSAKAHGGVSSPNDY